MESMLVRIVSADLALHLYQWRANAERVRSQESTTFDSAGVFSEVEIAIRPRHVERQLPALWVQ